MSKKKALKEAWKIVRGKKKSNPKKKKTPKCPKCGVSLKYVGMGRYQYGKKKYKVYQCPKCKKYFKE